MISPMLAAFKLPDLRKRILFVFGAFAVFVLGVHIPLGAVDEQKLMHMTQGFLGFLDVFSGGAFRKFSIFAMGVIPYINASIIFQLLGIALPRIQQMAKEGESGRKKISQWTRYLTVILAAAQGTAYALTFKSAGAITVSGPWGLIEIVLGLTAGTAFLMWLGEQITDKGIGNGVSLIIFCGIMIRLPQDVFKTFSWAAAGGDWFSAIKLVGFFIGTIAFIIWVQQAIRKIPIQHAKRVVGTRIYGGASSHLPIKVNTAGVIPIIFAISLQMLPGTLATYLPISARWQPFRNSVLDFLNPGQTWTGALLYFALVFFFTYFYTAVVLNVPDMSDNLKKYGGFIPGIRPGKPTEEYLDRVLTRVTFAGAIFLGIVALAQYFTPVLTGVPAGVFSLVGGTSLLIVVGVALETMQGIEAHLVMRHYEGFIR